MVGCATPGVGTDASVTPIQNFLASQPPPPSGMSQVIVYRDSGQSGMLAGILLEADGREVVTIANKKYASALISPGAKEFTVSLTVPGNPKCTKTLFIAPNQTNYLKIGARGEYSNALAILVPLAGLIKDSVDQDKTRCGGPWEAFLVKEVDAIREISSLR